MKRTLRFLTIAGGIIMSLLCADKASAQVTAINATYVDSANNYCTSPVWVTDFVTYTVAGTPQLNDSITVYVNFGDGTDQTYKVLTTSQGSISTSHIYSTVGIYTVSVSLTNTNNITTTVFSQPLVITNSCASLNGDVYVDGNNNCTFDMGEQGLLFHTMKVTNTTTLGSYYAIIDNNGHYAINVPVGYTYDIELSNMPGSLTPTCPNTSGVVSQAVMGSGPFTNDFGYECTSGTLDYSVAGHSGGFRPGFDRPQYVFAYSDDYCSTTTATVTLELDPLLTYTSSVGPTPTVSGNTVTWSNITLGQFNSLASTLQIYTDVSAVLGTYICNTLYITYAGGPDADVTNDTITFCGIVANSFDPNDKSVSPMVDAVGTIQDGEMLNYHINFQNTGNDTAYNVVITDSLSSNLNMNTFQLLGSSHPVNVTWLDGNIINFRFENIYLPDSNVNEPASHGSVDYKISANTGLAPGTTINNTAYIYFDFNSAIVTNTTLSTIETPASVQNISNGSFSAKIFPNPANNELTVTTEGKNFSATVYDVVGRSVAVSVTNTGKVVINTSSMANGMYILSIKAGGKDMTTKINIQH